MFSYAFSYARPTGGVGGGGRQGVSFLTSRNCGAASVRVLQDNLVLSTELTTVANLHCQLS